MRALSSARRNLTRCERGFTLPELLVTIAIMGVLMGIATSTWQGVIESREADSAANQLASDLRLAHTSATNQLTEWHLIEDKVEIPDNPVVPDADYYLVRDAGVSGITETDVESRSLPERTSLAEFEDVTFDPDGSARELGGGDCDELSYEVEAASGEPSPSMTLTCVILGVERSA